MNSGRTVACGTVFLLAGLLPAAPADNLAPPRPKAPAVWAAPVVFVGTAEKGRTVVAVRRDGRVETWDRETGAPGESFRLTCKQPVALSRDGSLVASQDRTEGPVVVAGTATGQGVGRTQAWPAPG